MSSSRPIVVYDACVLYPAPLRDLLMWLALSGHFQARWTSRIHDEWKRNLLRNRSDLKQEHIERTIRLMNAAIPDCLVEDFEELIPDISLPDDDDRHVLAAAIRCNASYVVTFNEKDFPSEALSSHGITAIHPDSFVEEICNAEPASVLAAAKRQREQLKYPAMSIDDYLETLRRLGMVQTTHFLASYREVL